MVLYCELCIVCEEAERAGQAEEKIVVNFNVYQIPGEAEISAGGRGGPRGDPTCSHWVGGMQGWN